MDGCIEGRPRHSTNLPGSTCKTVLTRSRKVLARFCSASGTVTLKRLIAPAVAVVSVALGVVLREDGGDDDLFVSILERGPGGALPVRMSMMSGVFLLPILVLTADKDALVKGWVGRGRAVICGM